MSIITNDDLKIMVEVEDLLHKKLEITNGIKDDNNIIFDENDEEYEIWVKYWNMVEKFIGNKKKANKRSTMYNKKNAEYHRLSNNLYNARKRKDTKRSCRYARYFSIIYFALGKENN